MTPRPLPLPRVYPILDTATLAARRLSPLEAARAVIGGGARIVQFRHKAPFTRAIVEEAQKVAALCAESGVLFMMNDRADLALLDVTNGTLVELPEIELAGRPQGRFGVMDELTDGVAKLQRPGRRHQPAARAHQQRIAGGLTQPGQRAAHR